MIKSLMTSLHRPIYRARMRELVRRVVPELRPGDAILDVGCGEGTLARAILDDPTCPESVTARGLERVVRGGEPIEVIGYDGKTFPLEDNSVDVVIVADVLHHEEVPSRLMSECVRVARRAVIVKDHQVKGPLAQQRISFMDWAANAPYGVPCLYRYNTPAQWRAFREEHNLTPRTELTSMRLYPPVVNLVFGGSLQYFAVLERAGQTDA